MSKHMTLKRKTINEQHMTSNLCLKIIKVFCEHAHSIIGMLHKAKMHREIFEPLYQQ
jgi:hypothetical protein